MVIICILLQLISYSCQLVARSFQYFNKRKYIFKEVVLPWFNNSAHSFKVSLQRELNKFNNYRHVVFKDKYAEQISSIPDVNKSAAQFGSCADNEFKTCDINADSKVNTSYISKCLGDNQVSAHRKAATTNANSRQEKCSEIVNTIKFSPATANLSIIRTIYDKPIRFLVDTGAAVTVVSATVYNDLPEGVNASLDKSLSQSIMSASGHCVPVLGQIILPFTIDGYIYVHKVLVTPSLTYDVILGNDFLTCFNAIIDLQGNKLVLPDPANCASQTNLLSYTGRDQCTVYLTDTVTLPPMSEMCPVVPAYLNHPFDPGITGPPCCHAGALGIIRKIYTSFGGNCEPGHVSHMRSTLRSITNALADEAAMIRTVNGKTVQIIKMTDTLTNRVNQLSGHMKTFDNALSAWKHALNKFGDKVQCNLNANMEFLALSTHEINKIFGSLLRFIEIQDIVTQFAHLQDKEMIGYNDLPKSVISSVSSHRKAQSDLKFSCVLRDEGFPLIINPVTHYQHREHYTTLTTLATLPIIPRKVTFVLSKH